LSLFTFGFVSGSESLSSPFVFVIVKLSTALYSSAIHATFVNTSLSVVLAFFVTSHVNSIVSDFRFPFVYAAKFSVFVDFLTNVTLFVVASHVASYIFFALSDRLLNFNPVGNWSTIFVTLPAFVPSLYTDMLYVTISPVFTVTGSFLCLYVAVYSVSIVAVSIDGFLVVDVELDKSVVFPSFVVTFVMYFLYAMSNGVSFSIDITG